MIKSGMFKRDRYKFLNMYQGYVGNPAWCEIVSRMHWVNHPDEDVRKLYIDLTTDKYEQSKPSMESLTKEVVDALHHLKLKNVLRLIKTNSQAVKYAAIEGAELTPLIEERIRLDNIKVKICKQLGIDIIQ